MKKLIILTVLLALTGCAMPRVVKIAYYPTHDVNLEVEVTPLNRTDIELYERQVEVRQVR